MNNQYRAPNRLKKSMKVKSKDHAAPAKAIKAAIIAAPIPIKGEFSLIGTNPSRVEKGVERFLIVFCIPAVPIICRIGARPQASVHLHEMTLVDGLGPAFYPGEQCSLGGGRIRTCNLQIMSLTS